jgi:hypothetical protein
MTQMVMGRTIKTEKEEEVVVVEGKEKNVQYSPHTILSIHNIVHTQYNILQASHKV